MQGREPYNPIPAVQAQRQFTFGIYATTPPSTDAPIVLQRADEVNIVRRMLSDAQVSAVFLTGESGVGKSTLASLVYQRVQASILTGSVVLTGPRHFVWLSISSFANLPDVIAAILDALHVDTTNFFLLKPEQQIATLAQALRRPGESALVVLDQFEELLDPETAQGLVGRGALPAFFALLQSDLGNSRLLLTSYQSPYGAMNDIEESRVRSYLISRVSIPEGVTLLQQRGIQGSHEELSLIWQRCAGHVFALLLFSALFHLSKLSLSYLLNSPDYQPLWSGDVTLHMLDTIYRGLNPVQCVLLRALSLFGEPIPFDGIITMVVGDEALARISIFEQELETLTRHSLVQQTLNEEDVRCYNVHALLRQHIVTHYLDGSDSQHNAALSSALGVSSPLNSVLGELDTSNPEAHEVALAAGHMQVAAYYQSQADGRCPPISERTALRDVAPLLHAIRHYCLGWHWQQACDLLFAEELHESLMRWGTWHTLIVLYAVMLPPSGVLTRHDEGLISSHLGLLYARMGEPEQSQACYERALAIQQVIGDKHDEAVTLVNHGELLRGQGAMELARADFERARLLNQERQDPQIESAALHNLGLLYHGKKDYLQALNYYRQSLNLAYNRQERYDVGMIVTNIGMLLFEQGSQVGALALLFFARQLRQSLQDPGVATIERFFVVLEQKMGADAFARLKQAALGKQEQVLNELFPGGS